MFSNAWMRLTGCFLLAIFCTACSEWPAPFKTKDRSPKADRQAEYDPPSTYPGWAYDAPEHVKPAEELTPEPRIKRTDPLHYFTNEKVVMVRQPAGYKPEETPRVALWWTDNNGFHWQKAGYFGREQSFFPFEVTEDGDYGIRFVGPGQSPAVETPAYPERVYHVDTTLPEVEVNIEPNKSWYHPGDKVTIGWRAADYHLVEYPVQIGMLVDHSADEYKLVELQRDLSDEGTITYEIPNDVLNHEVRFRVEAADRAGNVGLAFSYALQVVNDEIVKGHMDHAMVPPTNEPQPVDGEKMSQAEEYGPPFVEEEVITTAEIVSVPFATEFAISNDDHTLFAWNEPFFAPMKEEGNGATTIEETPVADADVHTTEQTEPIVAIAAAEQPSEAAPTFPAITPSMFTGAFNADDLFDAQKDTTDSKGAARDDDTSVTAAPTLPAAEPPTAPAEMARNETPEPIDAVITDFEAQITDFATPPAVDAPAIPVIDAPSIERIDPTHGNGVLIPLPATIETESKSEMHATAHPWRILVETEPAAERTVWALPTSRTIPHVDQQFQGRMYADHPALRPVAEPGAVQHAVADSAVDDADVPPISIAP